MPSRDPTRIQLEEVWPRIQLEEVWLSKLNGAQQQYKDALAKWTAVFRARQHAPTSSPDVNYAFNRAARVETEARRKYIRVLNIFMDFVVRGKFPPTE
jgi:hypothetical protein